MSEGSRQECREAFATWFAGLPPAEQEDLRAKGITEPLDHEERSNGALFELGESDVVSEFNFGALDGASAESPVAMLAAALTSIFDAALRRGVSPIARARDLPIGLQSLLWMINWQGLRNKSMRELAGHWGCTRAALSWHVIRLSDRFGVRCGGMKSEQSRAAYQVAQKGNRNRLGTGKANTPEATPPADGGCHSIPEAT